MNITIPNVPDRELKRLNDMYSFFKEHATKDGIINISVSTLYKRFPWNRTTIYKYRDYLVKAGWLKYLGQTGQNPARYQLSTPDTYFPSTSSLIHQVVRINGVKEDHSQAPLAHDEFYKQAKASYLAIQKEPKKHRVYREACECIIHRRKGMDALKAVPYQGSYWFAREEKENVNDTK